MFKVGEIAIFVFKPMIPRDYKWAHLNGEECTIIAAGIVSCHLVDGPSYRVEFSDGTKALIHEECLRKRRPPEQPADEDFQRDLDKWLKRDRTATA